MRLILHPDSHCDAVSGIEVAVSRGKPSNLLLHYIVAGDPARFIAGWPLVRRPERTDDLWKHTCFEAFVKPAQHDGYFEFNFAPSFQWAAYRFTGYRQNRRDAEIDATPEECRYARDVYELRAHLRLAGISELAGDWRVGISAVIAEANGTISYWALKHPPGKADFHQADGFTLELPAT